MRLFKLIFVAAAMMLSALTPAKAALYTGDWDPKYGSPFDLGPEVLGWRGTATFEIPDACLVIGVVSSATCVGMRLVDADVTFYDYNTNATVEVLDYDPADLSGFSATFGAGGSLLSLTTNFFAQRNPVSSFSGIDDYGFRLQFVTAGVRMYHTLDTTVGPFHLGPISPSKCPKVSVFDGIFWPAGFICGYSGVYSDGTTAPAVVVTYARVPEPGSIALVLAALLAAAGTMHRTRRRSAAGGAY